jgi:hypothetical protein
MLGINGKPRAHEPKKTKKKGFNWEAEQLHDFVYPPSIPDCGPTMHGALSSGDVTVVDDDDLGRRFRRLKYAVSAASDIARVCPVP